MSYANGNGTIVQNHLERLPAITSTVLASGRRRAQDTAVKMSQRGAMKAAADRCNAAMMRLIELAYQTDDCGLCNVDPHTGVFGPKMSMPWSSRNYQRWALMRTEADVLAIHVKGLHDLAVPPLLTYDAPSKRWGVNLWDYPDVASAQRYAKNVELTAKDYQTISAMVRNRRGG